jgi:hypothetical protein
MTNFSMVQNSPISNFIKIPSAVLDLLQTGMAKSIGVFSATLFVNASK